MSGVKGTPDTWYMVLHEDDRGATIYALRPSVWLDLPCFENRWQAQVTGDGQHITSSEEVLAVAHMMLAAPDLLAALKRLESATRILPPDMDEPDSPLAQARAAIAKAEGGAA